MNLDITYCTERLQCTDEEKTECLKTVRLLAQASAIVYREGILALERLKDEMEKNGGAFFTECLEYLLNGCTKDEIGRQCEKLLAAGDYRGKEFLRGVVIADGMAAVADAGENEANPLCGEIAPWFGAGWHETVRSAIKEERTRYFTEWEAGRNGARRSGRQKEFTERGSLPNCKEMENDD